MRAMTQRSGVIPQSGGSLVELPGRSALTRANPVKDHVSTASKKVTRRSSSGPHLRSTTFVTVDASNLNEAARALGELLVRALATAHRGVGCDDVRGIG